MWQNDSDPPDIRPIGSIKDSIKKLIYNNDLDEQARAAFSLLEPTIDSYPSEMATISTQASKPHRTTKRLLMVEIDKLGKEYPANIEDVFFILYRIIIGDRFNFNKSKNEFEFFDQKKEAKNPIKDYIGSKKNDLVESILFTVITGAFIVFLPWSLLISLLVLGVGGTAGLIALCLENAVKTFWAVVKFILFLVVLAYLIIGFIQAGA